MNCGRGSFHGSCLWLSSLPSFAGFIPSSRAICTWAWNKWWSLRASTRACILWFAFLAMRVTFPHGALAIANYFAHLFEDFGQYLDHAGIGLNCRDEERVTGLIFDPVVGRPPASVVDVGRTSSCISGFHPARHVAVQRCAGEPVAVGVLG